MINLVKLEPFPKKEQRRTFEWLFVCWQTACTILLLSLLAFIPISHAEAQNKSAQKEIDHLIEFVASTSCLYERNGNMHSGAEAVEHIQKKYNYFREDVLTAEDFIEYAASKSTLSGKAYRVHCKEKAVTTSELWLLQALLEFRSAHH